MYQVVLNGLCGYEEIIASYDILEDAIARADEEGGNGEEFTEVRNSNGETIYMAW